MLVTMKRFASLSITAQEDMNRPPAPILAIEGVPTSSLAVCAADQIGLSEGKVTFCLKYHEIREGQSNLCYHKVDRHLGPMGQETTSTDV